MHIISAITLLLLHAKKILIKYWGPGTNYDEVAQLIILKKHHSPFCAHPPLMKKVLTFECSLVWSDPSQNRIPWCWSGNNIFHIKQWANSSGWPIGVLMSSSTCQGNLLHRKYYLKFQCLLSLPWCQAQVLEEYGAWRQTKPDEMAQYIPN